jgi:hypothetical protein
LLNGSKIAIASPRNLSAIEKPRREGDAANQGKRKAPGWTRKNIVSGRAGAAGGGGDHTTSRNSAELLAIAGPGATAPLPSPDCHLYIQRRRCRHGIAQRRYGPVPVGDVCAHVAGIAEVNVRRYSWAHPSDQALVLTPRRICESRPRQLDQSLPQMRRLLTTAPTVG